MANKRLSVNEQDPDKRVKNFDEVSLGYSQEFAIAESERCLQCKDPQCVSGCPVGIDIPAFIKLLKDHHFDAAAKKIKENNILPGICGRVCPQEKQCELKCILGVKSDPVAIGYLERFAADHEETEKFERVKKNKFKVAVVGSGPGGVTCALELAKRGYNVTIYEALHELGGVLTYGIPPFRLPREVLHKEFNAIKKLGVKVKLNSVIGRTLDMTDLDEIYDSIFIGVGAGLPRFMGIPGEELNCVYSANEFLTRINLMNAHKFPEYDTPVKKGKHIVVVGGGNVAIDSARCARRLGSRVTLVYRRSRDEMPARAEEVKHAQEEGIDLLMLTNPRMIVGEGTVEGIECIQMKLADADGDGRRTPLPIYGSEFIIECDQVIMAIGQGPNPLLAKQLFEQMQVHVRPNGGIIVDENNQTTNPKIFAGGDITSGDATVIKAMGDGKKAANAIDAFLNS